MNIPIKRVTIRVVEEWSPPKFPQYFVGVERLIKVDLNGVSVMWPDATPPTPNQGATAA